MAASENSFDVACKLDMQEVSNAINQAKREIETRYDLKGAKNEIQQEKMDIVLSSSDDMKLKAILDILQSKLHRRGIDLKALTIKDPESAAGGTEPRIMRIVVDFPAPLGPSSPATCPLGMVSVTPRTAWISA